MNWSNIVTLIFDILWLSAVLLLLWLIWRTSVQRNKSLEKTLADISFVNAEASKMNAETLRKTIEAVQNMVSLLKNKKET